jgi:hypothetical protein
MRWLRAALVLLCTAPHMGCNMFILFGYLLGGPPSIEPDFDTQTKKSLSEEEKKVLILCYAPTEVKWDFEAIDRELAKHVSHRLNQNHIKVVHPDAVQAWLDQNSDWDKPQQIGADLKADYVIFIELSTYSLYEENSSNLFRGRSDVIVSVYEMDKETGDGDVIYNKEVASRFPLHEPVSTHDMSYYDFRRLYMSRLSEEIGWLFYEHYAGDDIPHGAL